MAIEKEKFDKFVEFIKKSFEEVTRELVDSEYESNKALQLNDDTKIAIIIGVCGRSKGRILLESNFLTANNFAIAMNCGDPLDEPNDLYMYVAEFANMFCGRATTYSNNEYQNREFWLTPPAIFSGDELEINSPSIQAETVYYKGEQGIFLVEIGFEGG